MENDFYLLHLTACDCYKISPRFADPPFSLLQPSITASMALTGSITNYY